MRRFSAFVATAMLALCFGAGQALATEGDPSADQAAGQSAESGQSADGYGGAFQAGPTNNASSIRVLSPGDDGDVSQSNSSTAGAIALNGNTTGQSIDQTQAGGYGSDQTQIAGQSADNDQWADADATAVQVEPKNTASSIRVLSPGDNGDVTQSNSASAGALAANGNTTDQSVDQTQAGGGWGSDSTQIAGQSADNDQGADADATAVQIKPENTARSIRVLSPGDDGDVTQSNDTTALAVAANGNETDQSIAQTQGGLMRKPVETNKAKDAVVHPAGSSSTQIAGQSASNRQWADADATAVQIKPENTASSIRVLSPGDDGKVTQSNDATAIGIAANANKTSQSIGQSQGGGYGSDSLQVAGQGAWSEQGADADATAVQLGAKNEVAPVRVGSPSGKAKEAKGKGDKAKGDKREKRDSGSVEQSNRVGALAVALNLNATCQSLLQTQTGSGSSLQVGGQGSWSTQYGSADAFGLQGVMPKKK